jgi:hypothetical protein
MISGIGQAHMSNHDMSTFNQDKPKPQAQPEQNSQSSQSRLGPATVSSQHVLDVLA